MAQPDPAGFFDLDPAPARIGEIDTPVPVIDLDIVARNAVGWQARCDARGLGNRPHVKTHKLVPLARYQMALGAAGLTVQKLGEAEVMAAAGMGDLLLTFNILGGPKLARLAALMRVSDIRVVADSAGLLPGLGAAAAAGGRSLSVLVECDTGAGRNGVQDPGAARALAREIDRTPGLRFGGLMTYPRSGGRREMAAFLAEAQALCQQDGLPPGVVSGGGTPDMGLDEGLDGLTEYRAGTYLYNDRSLVAGGRVAEGACALSALATVVSLPASGRAILDAGSKALTSDLFGLAGFGVVQGSGAVVRSLSEEHGILDTSTLAEPPGLGAQVRIIPNHVCPVSNLFDRVLITRGAEVLGYARVDARGCVA